MNEFSSLKQNIYCHIFFFCLELENNLLFSKKKLTFIGQIFEYEFLQNTKKKDIIYLKCTQFVVLLNILYNTVLRSIMSNLRLSKYLFFPPKKIRNFLKCLLLFLFLFIFDLNKKMLLKIVNLFIVKEYFYLFGVF